MRPLACPADETLAAFVDGQLPAVERAALVEHLAACAPCREAVGSAAEFADAAEPLQRVKRGTGALWALAATLITALLLYWGVDRRPGRPAPSPAEALLARHPPATLASSTWTARPNELGFGVSRTASQRALLWGVAQTDLEVALAASDRERLGARLDGLCQLLEGWAAAGHYRAVLRRLEQGALPEAVSLEPPAGILRPGVAEGRWLEAARLAAAVDDEQFLADPGLRQRLRDVGALLDDAAAQRLLNSVEAELAGQPVDRARRQRIVELLADLLRTL